MFGLRHASVHCKVPSEVMAFATPKRISVFAVQWETRVCPTVYVWTDLTHHHYSTAQDVLPWNIQLILASVLTSVQSPQDLVGSTIARTYYENSITDTASGSAPYFPASLDSKNSDVASAWVQSCRSSQSAIKGGEFCCMTANDLNCCEDPTNNLNLSAKATISAYAVEATFATSIPKATTQSPSTSIYITTVLPDQITSLAHPPTGQSLAPSSKIPSARKVAVAVGTLCVVLALILFGVSISFVLRRRKERLRAEKLVMNSPHTKDPSSIKIVSSRCIDKTPSTGPLELQSPTLPSRFNPIELEEKTYPVEIDDKMCLAELETSYPIARRDFQPPMRKLSELSADTTLVSPLTMPYGESHRGAASVSTLPSIVSRYPSFQRNDTLKFSKATSFKTYSSGNTNSEYQEMGWACIFTARAWFSVMVPFVCKWESCMERYSLAHTKPNSWTQNCA